jgi:hypothetical protein
MWRKQADYAMFFPDNADSKRWHRVRGLD